MSRLKTMVAMVMINPNIGASISTVKLKTVARAVPNVMKVTMKTEPTAHFTVRKIPRKKD
jgi:hypothetical protein